MDNKNKKKINCGICVNKLLILDQDVLVRICSKVNGDKMVKNFFLIFTGIDVKEVE